MRKMSICRAHPTLVPGMPVSRRDDSEKNVPLLVIRRKGFCLIAVLSRACRKGSILFRLFGVLLQFCHLPCKSLRVGILLPFGRLRIPTLNPLRPWTEDHRPVSNSISYPLERIIQHPCHSDSVNTTRYSKALPPWFEVTYISPSTMLTDSDSASPCNSRGISVSQSPFQS